MTKQQNLHDQSMEELNLMLDDTRNILFDRINQQRITKKIEKPHEIKQNRKQIARLMTIIRQKQNRINDKSKENQ